ncbi:hypothetical protein EVAR_59160_1 [Eumeta japonica]|uniref:Uncharacterized protein n=1 Tax=Eumeta variegata TaxID=151549 RepID=A0A4C1YT70_EUMVA|nr:hypothetical protein EVAR_59160_1 [Eumeta japonica]
MRRHSRDPRITRVASGETITVFRRSRAAPGAVHCDANCTMDLYLARYYCQLGENCISALKKGGWCGFQQV